MARKQLFLKNNPLAGGPSLAERKESSLPYREIPLSAIDRDPNQPRVHFDQEKLDELATSIATYGVLTPVLVRPGRLPGKFILVAGERRLKAAGKAGLQSIPAMVDNEPDESGERTLAIQLVENLQRAELTSLERAHAIGALRDAFKLSVRKVADRLGISKSSVQRSLELLELPDDLINALREGAPESKILELSKVKDLEQRKAYLKNLDSLTREEIKVVRSKTNKPKTVRKSKISPEDARVVDEMQRALGLKVKLTRKGKKSENAVVSIETYSDSDLQLVFRKLISED